MAPGIKTNNFDLGAHTAKIQNLTLALAFSLPFLGPCLNFRECGPWAAQNLGTVGYWATVCLYPCAR